MAIIVRSGSIKYKDFKVQKKKDVVAVDMNCDILSKVDYG